MVIPCKLNNCYMLAKYICSISYFPIEVDCPLHFCSFALSSIYPLISLFAHLCMHSSIHFTFGASYCMIPSLFTPLSMQSPTHLIISINLDTRESSIHPSIWCEWQNNVFKSNPRRLAFVAKGEHAWITQNLCDDGAMIPLMSQLQGHAFDKRR